MEKLRADYAGSNVTIPHKLHVMPFLDSIAREAKAIGAVNTIKFDENGAEGYNTDYFGFGRMLEYNNIDVRAKRMRCWAPAALHVQLSNIWLISVSANCILLREMLLMLIRISLRLRLSASLLIMTAWQL